MICRIFSLSLLTGLAAPAIAVTIIDFSGPSNTGSDAPGFGFTPWADVGGDNVRSAAYGGPLNSAPTAADGLPIVSGAAYHASIGGGAGNIQPTFETQIAAGGSQPQPDRLRVRGSRDTGFPNLQRFVLATEKADFLGGPYALPLGFTAADSISFEVSGSGNGNVTSMNFVVRDGSTWYISESFVSGASPGNFLTINDPDSANWAVFDITASTNFGGIDGTAVSGSPHAFSDVQAVGFFVEQTWPATSGSGQTDFRNWSVSATPIPEPSAAWLLLAGAVGSLRRRRVEESA